MTSKPDHCVLKKILELKTELPKALWWWSLCVKPNLSNSTVYSFYFMRWMYFSVVSFSEVEGALLAFRNHILVLKPIGTNLVRVSGDVLSQILKEGLFFFFFCWSSLRMCDLYLCLLSVCFVLNVELTFHFILPKTLRNTNLSSKIINAVSYPIQSLFFCSSSDVPLPLRSVLNKSLCGFSFCSGHRELSLPW